MLFLNLNHNKTIKETLNIKELLIIIIRLNYMKKSINIEELLMLAQF